MSYWQVTGKLKYRLILAQTDLQNEETRTKVTEPGKALLKEVILRPPYNGARNYFYITDVDDRDYLVGLIKATLPALPKPKARL